MRRAPLAALSVLSLCAGCVSMMQPNKAMRSSEAYARAHKGEGTRRVLASPQKAVRDALIQGWAKSEQMEIKDEGDAIFASTAKLDFVYAAYFYPALSKDQTDVEILIASPWLKPAQIKLHEGKLLDGMAKGVAEKARAPKPGPARFTIDDEPGPASKAPASETRGSEAPASEAPAVKFRADEPAPKPTKAFDGQL